MITKLFCIPHAGGSASIYFTWKKKLESHIRLYPVELAGRGSRYEEPFYKTWQEASQDIYVKIISQLEPGDRYAIYGHSMGSWLALEVLHIICSKHMPQPEHMFFSGNTPPYYETKEEKIATLPDKEFIEKIIAMGDTPREIFEESVVNYFLPVIRQDYRLVESYPHHYVDIPYNGNIHTFYGRYDAMTKEEVMLWSKYKHKEFTCQAFESGHMFIKEQADSVVEKINAILRKEKR